MGIYLIIWAVLAIDPNYFGDWLLENVLVFLSLPLILYFEKRIGFSKLAALCLFLFFTLHAVGAHYTYAKMELFDGITAFFGWERNHYDRIVHFSFGFLLFLPWMEVLRRYLPGGRSAMAVTLLLLFSMGGAYEIVEWGAAEVFNPELGISFLGAQGDQWDAQKDMALGHLGALLAFVLLYKSRYAL